MSAPNIVLFITHDTGRFVSPCGVSTVHTPYCRQLAEQGVSFSRAFSTAPLCSPGRACLTTGTWPQQNGMLGLAADAFGGFQLNTDCVDHAARLFASGGFESVLCGFAHETSDCHKLGFERFLSGPGRGTNGPLDSRNHAGAIDQWLASRDASRPFYLQIGSHETHLDWDAYNTPPDDSLGVTVPPYLRDLPEVRGEVAKMQGAIRRMDEVLGAILQTLQRRDVADNTLFVFTTDHGVDLPMAKGTLYDPGFETFLFLRWPRCGWGKGRVVQELTSQIDLLPTLLDACGVAIPQQCRGRSFLPLLEGRNFEPAKQIFAGKTFHDDYEPVRCVRGDRWKYIRYFEMHFHHDLRTATIDRRHWVADKTKLNRRWHEELFDLSADPQERVNLASDKRYDDVLRTTRDDLLAWMRRESDPLLSGPVQSPKYRRLLGQFTDQSGMNGEPL